MSILEAFFLILFLPLTTNASEHCPMTTCGKNSMAIRFPFLLQGQQTPNCGYSGFNITCSSESIPVLKLPYSGEFLIRHISYGLQLIVLNDPGGCLPRRLQSLNLSGSPFKAPSYRNYIFLSCPSKLEESQLNGIDCLGNSTHSVLATSNMKAANSLSHLCHAFATLSIPVAETVELEEDDFITELNEDLPLKWDVPRCGDCVEQGGTCGYVNETSNDVGCFYDDQTGKRDDGLRVFRIIVLAIAAPAILCATGMAFFVCLTSTSSGRNRQHMGTAHQNAATEPETVERGLDEATIESYKKIVLGESKRLPGPNNNTCPICLSEYSSKETIRCIPECDHCFHVECIDEWLRLHSSCPLCRKTPSPNHV